jgi:hypothetical protein
VATVSSQNPGLAGLQISTSTASAGGDKVSPGARVHVHNGHSAAITCTIATPGTARGGLAIADKTITVTNGSFPANLVAFDVPADPYQDPADGLVSLAWSTTTNITFWAEGPVTS